MGTDIHFYVEKRSGRHWVHVPGPQDEIDQKFDIPGSWYKGRNYNLFALLADVRNGSGFAGCDTGDAVEPIAMPRGVPQDVSAHVRTEYILRVRDDADPETVDGVCTPEDAKSWTRQRLSRWWDKKRTLITHPDWHSATWFTIRELLDYNWKQTFVIRGQMLFKEYEAFRKSGETSPKSYAGGIWNGRKAISAAEAEQIIEGTIEMRALRALGDYEQCPVTLEWSEPYEDVCADFLRVLRTDLVKIGKPEKVRAILWFDN